MHSLLRSAPHGRTGAVRPTGSTGRHRRVELVDCFGERAARTCVMAFVHRSFASFVPFSPGAIALAAITLTAFTPRLAAQDSLLARLDTARISAAVRSEMQANGAPGASIAVVIGDRVVYRNAFGVRSAETQD